MITIQDRNNGYKEILKNIELGNQEHAQYLCHNLDKVFWFKGRRLSEFGYEMSDLCPEDYDEAPGFKTVISWWCRDMDYEKLGQIPTENQVRITMLMFAIEMTNTNT